MSAATCLPLVGWPVVLLVDGAPASACSERQSAVSCVKFLPWRVQK